MRVKVDILDFVIEGVFVRIEYGRLYLFSFLISFSFSIWFSYFELGLRISIISYITITKCHTFITYHSYGYKITYHTKEYRKF